MTRQYRPAPPPLDGNEKLATGLITAGWAIALIVVVLVRHRLPSGEQWWIWTCAAGFGMGVFGLWYVPRLKRARARAAQRRAAGSTDRQGSGQP